MGWSNNVDPVAREITANKGRAERTSRIHRRPADRRRPQPGKCDVTSHANRRRLRQRSGPQRPLPKITLTSSAVRTISIANACPLE